MSVGENVATVALSGGDALRRPERVPRTAIPVPPVRRFERWVEGNERRHCGATDAADYKRRNMFSHWRAQVLLQRVKAESDRRQ
jgi:hypothetical protein